MLSSFATENLATPRHAAASVKDYVMLLKPRVMTLVVFSGWAGLMAAPGTIHPLLAAIAMLCLCLGAGASGAFNMWYDRDIDAVMTRTQTRPLPAGRMVPDEALGFALTVGGFAVCLLGLLVNWVAAFWLLFAMLFYGWFYTMVLKRRTPQNIVIGGAAGAFPPVVGWACVTGGAPQDFLSHLFLGSAYPWLMFLIIFLWTPPHFWALALVSCQDYAKANIPMLPLTHGETNTRVQMLAYTLVLWGVSVLPFWLGYASPAYGMAACVLGGLFTVSAVQVMRLKTARAAWLMFGYSILYLFLIFAFVIGDTLY